MPQASPRPTTKELQIRFPLCEINSRIEELSARLGLALHEWVEPGMGPAIGFACELSSGMPLVLEQFLLARESFGAGPTIYVEAEELLGRSTASIVSQVVSELGLAADSITWRQTDEGVQAAGQLVEAWAKRQHGGRTA